MDKLREDFEKWWQDENYDNQLSNIQGVMFNRIKNGMFAAWQASRASVVVDTPKLCGDGENDSEYTEGYNDGITATEKTILSIGLSIKGE